MGVLFWFFRMFFGTLRRAGWTVVVLFGIMWYLQPHFVGNLIGLGLHKAGSSAVIGLNEIITKGENAIKLVFLLVAFWWLFFGGRGRGRNNRRRQGDRR